MSTHHIVLHNFGRSHLDATPHETLRGELGVWEWVRDELAEVSYQVNGEAVTFQTKAESVVADIQRQIEMEKAVRSREFDSLRELADARQIVKLSVDVEPETIPGVDVVFLVLRHVANIYAVCNLAAPGSFGAGRVELSDGTTPEFGFRGELFEDSLLESQRHGWPRLGAHDPKYLWLWLRALGLGLQERSAPSTLSALFCLLHAAQAPFATPTAMLWTSQALETLYLARRGAIEKSLVQRGSRFLKIPGPRHSDFAKRMRRFYSLRSAFIHGNEQIVHPVFTDSGWGEEVYDQYEVASRDAAFAAGTIVATLRELATRNLSGLRFSEAVTGVPL